jgi:hypothetical protein
MFGYLMFGDISPCYELNVILVEAKRTNQYGLIAERVTQVLNETWADSSKIKTNCIILVH